MALSSDPETLLSSFRNMLDDGDTIAALRSGLIGEGMAIPGPFGPKPLIYADYVASGRALRQVEDFVLENVLPYYANSHTEASFCGQYVTRLRRSARHTIARLTQATNDYAVIFLGSGATAGINRLVHLLGVPEAAQRGERPVVFIGPYEHHSNILPWRESGAEVIEIPEADEGGPDIASLEAVLELTAERSLRIGAFSAASNVTGITADVDAIGALLNRHGVVSVWDYAGGGPYLPIRMGADSPARKDAVVLSPHKFLGGPAASGVLIVRKAAVKSTKPVNPGGGTVSFVSPWFHDYSRELSAREEAGTPDVVGDIRAALAFLVKDAVGDDFMHRRHGELTQRALSAWSRNPNLVLLGGESKPRLPIFSFRVRDAAKGGYVHHQLFTRMLSDCHGVQARGGCACAGPYAHRLLELDADQSSALRAAIRGGAEIDKPGWVRLNFSALLTDEKADTIIDAVDALARNPYPFADDYRCDLSTARFHPLKAA